MARFSASGRASDMLDGLKSRLGFGGSETDDGYDAQGEYDDGYDDAYGDYDDGFVDIDIDDYGYDDPYSSDYPGYGSDYSESSPAGAYRSRSGRDGGPRLVSIDDVRADTRARARERERMAADDGGAHEGRIRERTDGLDSLFASTTPSDTGRTAGYVPATTGMSTGYDPYEAYTTPGAGAYTSVRALTVLKPVSYADAERIAKALKAGDVVVIVLRNTPDDLSKRILDFAFGAASVLDASVECPAEKVFAVTQGEGLSEGEKSRLRSQGVL